ncbi:unnamed protein product [Paramecium pentaurelia]|uniref:EIPR1-like beta-propeller domain-containing protein n=1 Tax=Paramecium pentaurelia TaxID=43138 RepID=A0A8S1WH61_9CILI|nr:unnamed protein product [Paramecium pentaurelia]
MDQQTQPVQISFGEQNCRCVSNIVFNKRHVFAVGTWNAKKNNEIYVNEYLELEQKIVQLHKIPINGMIEKIIAKKEQLYVIYIDPQQRKTKLCCIELADNGKYQVNFDLLYEGLTNVICPEDDPIIYLSSNKSIIQFDLNKQSFDNIIDDNDLYNLCEQDPHHKNLFVRSQNNYLCIQDTREKKVTKFKAHSLQILDIDFNPNKQYYLITGGEDCLAKVWDIRKTQYAIKSFEDLQNSVLQAKFNKFHDQLVSLSFDDGTISLYNITSVSSVPQLNKEDDYLVKQYDEHEDSIYGLSWSRGTAWVLASIGYSGHMIINTVPTTEKYKILL